MVRMIVPVHSPEQIRTVAALAREIWHEHYVPIIGLAQVAYMVRNFQSEQAIAGHIREGYEYFLMEENAGHLGYLAVQQKQQELFLSKLYVKAQFRNKGFGRKAIEFVAGLARRKKCVRVGLAVNKTNFNSIKAYEHFGFCNKGPLYLDIGGGFAMDDYKMEMDV